MGSALLYLTVCSLRNRIRVRVQRLREPRYLGGLVVGILYFYFMLFRPRRGRPMPEAPGAEQTLAVFSRFPAAFEVLGAVGLFIITAIGWVLPNSGRPALTFSRADVQLLFPAPITRRQLIHYKILRSQVGTAFASALVSLAFHAARITEQWLIVFVGTLVVMTTVNLHLTGVALRRDSLAEHGLSGLRQAWLPLTLILTIAFVIVQAIVGDWYTLSLLNRPSEVLREIERIGTSGAVRVVLAPFVLLIRLPLSSTFFEFLQALPMALALLFANYVWVVRSDAAFEEAAADYAERHAALSRETSVALAANRRRAEPFHLAPTGRPEVALLWKNLILASRAMSLRVLNRVLAVVLVSALLLSTRATTFGDALAGLCVIAAALATFFGAQSMRNDLRRDLSQLVTIKSWPMPGAAVVRGEVLAPTVILSAIVAILIVAAALLSRSVPFSGTMPPLLRLSYAAGAIIFASGLVLVQVVIHNAMAVLFPAWAEVGASRSRGIDVMGQRLLLSFGLLVTLAVACIPAAAVA
jgi:ABC-2 type transport system permease protein